MRTRLSGFLATSIVLASLGWAQAQTGPSLSALSDYERNAANRLIDRLHSAPTPDFTAELTRAVDDLAARGLSPKPVFGVLRASAGDRRELLDTVLNQQCRFEGPRRKYFCDVADLEDPRAGDVQTAATGAAAGGGALGGPISATTGATGGGGGNAGGVDSSNPNTPPSFSFRGGSGGGSTTGGGSSTTTVPVVAVPGPVAGAGLASVLLLAGLHVGRRVRVKRHPQARDLS